MGLFKKAVPQGPAIKGAASATRYPFSQNVIGNFVYYTQNLPRDAAMQVPTISRARDLICSMVACLTFKQYSLQWNGEYMEKIYLPPDTWFQQPDPNVTRNFILSWTTEDLIMQGRAFWVITERLGNGFPSKFTWIPAGDVNTLDQSTGQWFGPSKQIYFQGIELNPNDVVQFLSPIQGLVYTGVRAINTANRLQNAAERFASQTIPAGYLKQTGGEPMTGQELAEMAAAFAAAREDQTIAALNEFVDYVPNTANPDDLQLTDARTFQSLEMARLANIPPFLVGAPTGGGMTYQNSAESNKLLYLYGSKPYIECIEQTLSMNNVLPRGRYVELDVRSYLQENDLAGGSEGNAAPTGPSAITEKTVEIEIER